MAKALPTRGRLFFFVSNVRFRTDIRIFLVQSAGPEEGGTGGPGSGMQERARRWRRAEAKDILAKTMTEAGAGRGRRGVIATAHHKDDQAETVLLKALRGAHITNMQVRKFRDRRGAAIS